MDPIALLRTARPFPDHPLVLELDLARGVISQSPSHPLEAFRARHSAAMRQIRDGLRKAATDKHVAGLVIHVGSCPLSPDQCDEIGELLHRFGQHKPTIAWTESFGELGNATMAYRVASFAQEVWLAPSGTLGLNGVQLGITLLRGGLEKLNVEPQFAQRKEYKTAADQFAAREITDEHREMMQRIADSILEDTIAGVAERRHLDPAAIRHVVDNSPVAAEAAREAGLVDRLGYRDEVYAELRRRFGTVATTDKRSGTSDADRKVSLQYAHRYSRSGCSARLEEAFGRRKPAIGLVELNGSIIFGPSQSGPSSSSAGSDTITAHLREAARDETVKAVVLRINSPGGSYIASDTIRREVQQLRATGKPVIASMGTLAASGGYFAAMGCDAIVANPTTLTGSIGVLAGKFVLTGLTDRMGLIREDIIAGANAGWFSSHKPFDETEWAKLNSWLDDVYADFTTKAAEDRGLDLADLEPLARGRVWTGADAHERKLVDRLGGMATALDLAAERLDTKLDALQVRGVPALPWLEQLKPAESSESRSGASVQAASALEQLLTGGPEDRLTAIAELSGIGRVDGVLALPWRLSLR
ncbi:signal peptide peptidase SppA [Granulicoccus sp. GXG6511]|uniref:signal peptide peptidase SppA n=1 Tax=Granulicoccus sp. GXG6511 TaxID=3381351 RepID=UPI003D7EB93B